MSDSRPTSPASGVALRSAGDQQPARRLGNRPALDGVRGIAVLLVIAVHVGLLDSGDLGVDLFFPLSGFLITALLYEEYERHGALSLRRFYARRARRLLPALTVVVVVVFAVLSLFVHTFRATMPRGTLVGSTLLFANNWVTTLSAAHGRALGPLAPTWSLGQEGQFYLVWPAVLALLLRWRRRTSFVLGLLGVSILVLVAAVPLVRHAYPVYNPYTSPLDRTAEMLLGCAAAILWRERRLPRLLGRPITGWVAFAGLAYVLAEAGAPRRTSYLAAAVLVTLLIVSLLTDGQPASISDRRARRLAGRAGGALSAALSSAPLRFTGKVSYGIYLYHLPIYYLLLHYTYAPGRSHYFYGAIVLAASLLAAACSWKLFESPIIHGIAPVSRINRAFSVHMRRDQVAEADRKPTTTESNDHDLTVPTSISSDIRAVTGLNTTQPETTDTTNGTGAAASTSTTPASNATGATAPACSRYWSQETQTRAA
jgi:peptidoglycan/LPS O-acetylase OafA/YrhL